MRRNKIFAIAAVVTLLAGYGVHEAHTKAEMSEALLANVEAISQDESTDRDWLSALRPEECTVNKVNMGAAFYYKGVLIPAGGSYTVMGTRMECKFNLFNSCDISKQATCKE